MSARLSVFPLLAMLVLGGCDRHASEADKEAAAQAAAARQQQIDDAAAMRKAIPSAEQQLAQIPPPAKGRYLQVRTVENWANPFLLVGWKTMDLRLMMPQDAGSADPTAAQPGLLKSKVRLTGPGHGQMTLRLIELPQALSALPQSSWQYGRVIAVEEDPTTPKRLRPQMRRNLEAVLGMLNDLDVVVDEWPYGQR